MKIYRNVKLVYYGEKIEIGNPITGPREVYDRLAEMKLETVETFRVIFLDARHRMLREAEFSRGTLKNALVHPVPLFRLAISEAASALILAHNHPTGNPSPSNEDIEITKRMVKIGHLIEIPVLDHIIIGSENYFSIKEELPEVFKSWTL